MANPLFPGMPTGICSQNGLLYNEVGGQNLFMKEPFLPCPDCGDEKTSAEFCDNGFGPYAVQIGPYHCYLCGWTEGEKRTPEEIQAGLEKAASDA